MPRTYRTTFLSVSLALVGLVMMILACTSNDSLFIRLTETPTPSLTPTPLALETKLKKGDSALVIGLSDFASINMPPLPGPFQPGMAGGMTCFPNTKVSVLDISRNLSDPDDPTLYYQVQCNGIGWAPEWSLARFSRGDKPVVSAEAGAPLYSTADASGSPVGTCPSGSEAEVLKAGRNPSNDSDLNVYIEISCGTQQGWVVEDTLSPAQ
ncbi:MAG: hypothetical protein IAE83_14775 [Anaerolinea sp.]|nr:hypothetical protein [Anaerolinea sp.]MCC6973645.1 hypothetical protein [Anaerolineae bacterium]CAG1000760.1 hypothetical protein ANRL4_03119 [Anaerolineae bacterium]